MQDSSTILFDEAKQQGLSPRWESNYGVFSIDYRQKRVFLFLSFSFLNSQLSAYYSKNKHVTRMIIENFDPSLNIPYCLPSSEAEVVAFYKQHAIIISKPLQSFRSKEVYLINGEQELLERDYKNLMYEKYVPGVEYRYLYLEGDVIAVQRRENMPLPDSPWNKKRIAIEKPDWNTEALKIAINVAQTMRLNFCAVDFIQDNDGKLWILEVNTRPGLRPFHFPDEGNAVNIAKPLLESMLRTL